MESCDNETQQRHDDLSLVPMQDLSFADLNVWHVAKLRAGSVGPDA